MKSKIKFPKKVIKHYLITLNKNFIFLYFMFHVFKSHKNNRFSMDVKRKRTKPTNTFVFLFNTYFFGNFPSTCTMFIVVLSQNYNSCNYLLEVVFSFHKYDKQIRIFASDWLLSNHIEMWIQHKMKVRNFINFWGQ